MKLKILKAEKTEHGDIIITHHALEPDFNVIKILLYEKDIKKLKRFSSYAILLERYKSVI